MADENAKKRFSVLVLCKNEEVFLASLDKLGQEAFDVETAPDVYRAVASFAKRPVDAVVVELDALGESELECIRIFYELNKDVYVLAAFSQAHRHKAARALELGADGCLLQPFYPGELISTLKRWAERAMAKRTAAMRSQDDLAALQRLAKGAAHEINNPLTALLDRLEMMQTQEGRSQEERNRFASMREEAQRIAKVVERLLAFGLELPVARSPVDMNALLEELLGEIRTRAKGVKAKAGRRRNALGRFVGAPPAAKGVNVESELQAEEALVLGHETLLRQACKMLLDDAFAALNGGGTLTVRSDPGENGFLELSVRDNGRCIPAEHLEHIFEPYSYAGRAGEATSLTYPAAYGIVRSHGGELTVTSEQGRGTVFLVRLPRITIMGERRES